MDILTNVSTTDDFLTTEISWMHKLNQINYCKCCSAEECESSANISFKYLSQFNYTMIAKHTKTKWRPWLQFQ